MSYRLSKQWVLQELLKLVLLSIFVGIVFYNNMFFGMLMIPCCVFLWKSDCDGYVQALKKEFAGEFIETIKMLSSAMTAGYSLENAFVYTYKELCKDENSYKAICDEYEKIVNGLSCNTTIERLLKEFSERVDISQVKEFSELIQIAKKHGGNIIELIRYTSNEMSVAVSVEREIDTMISSKKLEGLIMLVMPFFIVVYLRLTNPGYVSCLYQGLAGRLIMSIALVITIVAYVLESKITNIM